jgi:hypothetical protein
MEEDKGKGKRRVRNDESDSSDERSTHLRDHVALSRNCASSQAVSSG